jgi:hypothetical protein
MRPAYRFLQVLKGDVKEGGWVHGPAPYLILYVRVRMGSGNPIVERTPVEYPSKGNVAPMSQLRRLPAILKTTAGITIAIAGSVADVCHWGKMTQFSVMSAVVDERGSLPPSTATKAAYPRKADGAGLAKVTTPPAPIVRFRFSDPKEVIR